MRRTFLALALTVAAGLAFMAADPAPKIGEPRYTPDGQLMRPADYREWAFVSSGLGMNYSAQRSGTAGGAAPMFTNVFVQPWAYKQFMATGHWPDKTVFALEIYSSASRGSINKAGRYQDGFVALEAEVKDSSLPDGWAYYGFGADGAKARPFPKEMCFSCHEQNAAVEHSFVQFYPTLLEVAYKKGTIKPSVHLTPGLDQLHSLIAEQGWKQAQASFREARTRDPKADVFDEHNLNMLGYRLLQGGKNEDAAGVFAEVATLYPDSANAQDSLADGYEAAGRKDQAMAAAQKTMALAPKDPRLNDAQRQRLIENSKQRIARLSKP